MVRNGELSGKRDQELAGNRTSGWQNSNSNAVVILNHIFMSSGHTHNLTHVSI